MHRIAATLLTSLLAASAYAQATPTDGEVRKVDKPHGTITLKHEDIRNLDMPAMTMVFTVRDKHLLDQIEAGEKVRFTAVQEGDGTLVVTGIQARK